MERLRADPPGLELRHHPGEERHLPGCLDPDGIVGRGEVLEGPLDPELREAPQPLDECVQLLGPQPEAGHPGVELQVDGEDDPPRPGEGAERGEHLERVEVRGQAEPDEVGELPRTDPPHHEDLRRDPGPSQLHPFLHDGDGEAVRSLPLEPGGHRGRAVPVAVGLHHRHHLAAIRKTAADRREVPGQRVQVDDGAGRAEALQ